MWNQHLLALGRRCTPDCCTIMTRCQCCCTSHAAQRFAEIRNPICAAAARHSTTILYIAAACGNRPACTNRTSPAPGSRRPNTQHMCSGGRGCVAHGPESARSATCTIPDARRRRARAAVATTRHRVRRRPHLCARRVAVQHAHPRVDPRVRHNAARARGGGLAALCVFGGLHCAAHCRSFSNRAHPLRLLLARNNNLLRLRCRTSHAQLQSSETRIARIARIVAAAECASKNMRQSNALHLLRLRTSARQAAARDILTSSEHETTKVGVMQEALKGVVSLRQYSGWITPFAGVMLLAGGAYTILSRVA